MSEKHWYQDGLPWGQFCAFLLAMSFFVIGMETLIVYLAVYAQLISPADANEASWLQLFVGLLGLAALSCAVIAFVTWGLRRVRKLPPLTRWPRLRVASRALFVVGIMAQTIALSIPAIIMARTAQQQAAADGQWHETVFADGTIRISTPPNWEVVPNPNALATSVHLADRQTGSGLTAVLVPKQDLAVKSLQELCEQSTGALAQSLSEPESGEFLAGELAGHPTLDVVQSGTLQGVNLVWRTRTVEYAHAWLELRIWTTRSRFEDQSAAFDRIAQSIEYQ